MADEKKHFEVLSINEMRQKYYKPGERPPTLTLSPERVPASLQILIPIAEKWGISDDILRHDALEKASPEEISALQRLVAQYDDLLDEWLAGPEAYSRTPTVEYLAFSNMRMAADGC